MKPTSKQYIYTLFLSALEHKEHCILTRLMTVYFQFSKMYLEYIKKLLNP